MSERNTGLEYILGGGPIENFSEIERPTYRDVLRYYSKYWRLNESDTSKEARVANALKNFYEQRNIETLSELTIRNKIRRQVLSLKKVLKFKSKEKTRKQIDLEKVFRDELSNIFQIQKSMSQSSSSNETMEIDNFEGKLGIYLYNRPSTVEKLIKRLGYWIRLSHEYGESIFAGELSSTDFDPSSPEISECEEMMEYAEKDTTNDSDDSDYDPSSPDDSEDEKIFKHDKIDIPDDILWEMFNTGVSFRILSKILELAFSLSNGRQTYNISASHLFEKYKRLSAYMENAYKNRIRAENRPGTICFDHSTISRLSNKFASLQNRLAVVWHSDQTDRLLTVGDMPDKAGSSQARVILNAVREFDIDDDQIVALSCDNAKTNDGHLTGTCVILEDELQKPLLRLMCNHHITELVIKDVYHFLFSSDAPNNLFYPILKESWINIRDNNFQYNPLQEENVTENFDGLQYECFDYLKNTALENMRYRLNSPSIRDDYKELNMLGLKFLGERIENTKPNQVRFKALINPSNARFMGVAIQGLKSYLFRNQLDWDSPAREKVKQNLERFALFVVLIYLPLWNGSNILFDAAINKIRFFQSLEKYAELDVDVANVAKTALCRHLVYMSQELSVLALFSEKLSCKEKNETAAKLLQQNQFNIPPRRIEPDAMSNHIQYSENIHFGQLNNLNIPALIGERSYYLFDTMKIPTNFLHVDAEVWPTNRDYLFARDIISKTLICVNDNSERVFAASKYKYERQRCKNEESYQRSMIATSYRGYLSRL